MSAMLSAICTLHDVRVLLAPDTGAVIATERDATDLIAAAWETHAKLVAIPAVRLAPEFFVLRKGLLGAFLQKFATYKVRVAILGDIDAQLSASKPLRDFVCETNRGNEVWFMRDMEALEERLGQ